MKLDSNFKMKKHYKCMLAFLCNGTENRSFWKKAFIEGQLAEEEARRMKLKSKEKGE